MSARATASAALALILLSTTSAFAQSIGTFRWRLAPYCNVVTLSVTQVGTQYRLEGYDDQCGLGPRAAALGLAVFNPDGTIQFGLSVVGTPGATLANLEVALSLASLGGTWRDSSGNSGLFEFSPPGSSGSPRPGVTAQIADGLITGAKLAAGAVDASKVVDGSLGAADINVSEVQRRVAGACAAGQYVQSVNGDGTVACGMDATGGGTITSVTAGAGLSGGGTSGAVTLGAVFAGSGAAATVARSDHTHAGMGDITSVVAGTGLSGGATGGDATLNVSFAGTGAASSAARSDHTHMIGAPGFSGAMGTGNTAIGEIALGAISLSAAAGQSADNTAIGSHAMEALGIGFKNTAVGSRALRFTNGSLNTAVGVEALAALGNATANTAIGYRAGLLLNNGAGNTAIGYNALITNVSGNGNVAVGSGALQDGTGSTNIGIGLFAGQGLTTGSNNIFIGQLANGIDNGNNNVIIAAQGQNDSNTLRLAQLALRAFIGGIRDVTTDNNNAVPVLVDSAGQLGVTSSSRRYKEDIAPLDDISGRLQMLRPVQFRYIRPFADGTKPLQYGLIAEEVNEVMPELVARGGDGEIETVKYHVLPSLLLAEVQRLERERDAQARQIADQAAALDDLRAQVAALTASMRR